MLNVYSTLQQNSQQEREKKDYEREKHIAVFADEWSSLSKGDINLCAFFCCENVWTVQGIYLLFNYAFTKFTLLTTHLSYFQSSTIFSYNRSAPFSSSISSFLTLSLAFSYTSILYFIHLTPLLFIPLTSHLFIQPNPVPTVMPSLQIKKNYEKGDLELSSLGRSTVSWKETRIPVVEPRFPWSYALFPQLPTRRNLIISWYYFPHLPRYNYLLFPKGWHCYL